MERLYWKAVCRQNRTEACSVISALANRHGALMDVNFFSDLSASFVVEVEGASVKALYADLQNCLLIDELTDDLLNQLGTYAIMLHVTFADGTGNLRVQVPAVPG
jgi:phage-related tail protein